MIVAIKFFVNGSVFYPEIGAEIDHARAGRQKRFGKFGGESVRQSQKNYFRVTGQLFRIGFTEPERVGFFNMGKTRKDLGKRFARELPRSCCDKIDMWMREQQADELFASVTGSAHDCDLGFAAEDGGLYRFFAHNAQCVFGLARIATKSCSRGGSASLKTMLS